MIPAMPKFTSTQIYACEACDLPILGSDPLIEVREVETTPRGQVIFHRIYHPHCYSLKKKTP